MENIFKFYEVGGKVRDEILEKFKEYKYVPKQYFKGHTECFNLEICENLKNI